MIDRYACSNASSLAQSHKMYYRTSFISLDIDERLSIAHDPTASRFLDALLESSTVSAKSKRAFIMSFIGHFHLLADDRIGSRICDRIFTFADTYLKVFFLHVPLFYVRY